MGSKTCKFGHPTKGHFGAHVRLFHLGVVDSVCSSTSKSLGGDCLYIRT